MYRSPDGEGYTISEACALASSSQPLQRAAALRLWAAVLARARQLGSAHVAVSSKEDRGAQVCLHGLLSEVEAVCACKCVRVWGGGVGGAEGC